MTAVGKLTLINAGKLTKAQRLTLVNWLRQQAMDLMDCGGEYADQFTSSSQTITIGEKQ